MASRGNGVSKSTYGKGNQNITPSSFTVKPRKDGSGKTDIFYGKKGSGSQHGHTVRAINGAIVSSRSISGKKNYNSGR